jgi:hypothetical protein
MQDFLVLDLNISRILGSMGMNGTWAGEDELPEDMIISVRLFMKQVLGCLLLRYLMRADVEDFGHGLCWIAGNERIGLGREASLLFYAKLLRFLGTDYRQLRNTFRSNFFKNSYSWLKTYINLINSLSSIQRIFLYLRIPNIGEVMSRSS